MNAEQINKEVREAVPTCSSADGCSDRYRVWLSDHGPVIYGRTKAKLRKNLTEAIKKAGAK